MSEEPSTPRELETLLQELEDGCIGPDDHARLMASIVADPEVRSAYCEHMAFASALHAEAVARMDLIQEAEIIPFESRQRHTLFRALFIAAAAVILIAATLSAIAARRILPAQVAGGEAAVWRFEAGGIAENRDFLPDTRLAVEHGTVEVKFSSGTRIVLEGPMQVEIRDRQLIHIADGSAWCEVAKGDEGFTVMTDRLRVIDLGTRFGVHTSPWGDQVHVAEGQVRVDSRLPGIEGRDLRAGRAVITDSLGRQREIPYDDAAFMRGLFEARGHLYWSFDGPGGMLARDAGGTAYHFAVDGGADPQVPAFAPGISGQALDLSASGVFATSDFPGFPGGVPRSIAFWMKGKPIPPLTLADSKLFNPPVIGWGSETSGGKWHITIMHDGSAIGSVWGGSWRTFNMEDGFSLLDDSWHHVASVFTGRHDRGGAPEIIHYLNGERIESSSGILRDQVNTEASGLPGTRLFIGSSGQPNSPSQVLPILIDELHLLRGVLRDEDVRRLASLRPGR